MEMDSLGHLKIKVNRKPHVKNQSFTIRNKIQTLKLPKREKLQPGLTKEPNASHSLQSLMKLQAGSRHILIPFGLTNLTTFTHVYSTNVLDTTLPPATC